MAEFPSTSPLLYLVRHAQSANNAQADEKRVNDPSITELGWHQALELGKHLLDIQARADEFESLICSGFRRALQTASQIQKQIGLVPEIMVDVHEHGGCYDGWNEKNFVGRPGLTAQEIVQEFGPVKIPADYPEIGWWESKPRETQEASGQRAIKVSNQFSERLKTSTGNLICVTHADFLAKLLQAMFGPEIREHELFHDLKNVGMTVVGLEESCWKLYQLNSVDFLEPERVSS